MCRMSLRNSYLQPLWSTWASLCQPHLAHEKKGDNIFLVCEICPPLLPCILYFRLCGTINRRAGASDADGDRVPSLQQQAVLVTWLNYTRVSEHLLIKGLLTGQKSLILLLLIAQGFFLALKCLSGYFTHENLHTAKWAATWGLWAAAHLWTWPIPDLSHLTGEKSPSRGTEAFCCQCSDVHNVQDQCQWVINTWILFQYLWAGNSTMSQCCDLALDSGTCSSVSINSVHEYLTKLSI